MIATTYIPPLNGYGANLAYFTFYVADNSGAANNKSQPLSVFFNVARVDLPPVALGGTIAAPDVGNVSFALTAIDPQGYTPLTITINSFPLFGTLFRVDGSAITPSSPTVAANGTKYLFCNNATLSTKLILQHVGVKGTYNNVLPLSYQVSSPSLTSLTATTLIAVYRVYDAPIYTGASSLSVPENTPANIAFSGYSETGVYHTIKCFFSF